MKIELIIAALITCVAFIGGCHSASHGANSTYHHDRSTAPWRQNAQHTE